MPANSCGWPPTVKALVGLLPFVLQQPGQRDDNEDNETSVGFSAELNWSKYRPVSMTLSLPRNTLISAEGPSLPRAQLCVTESGSELHYSGTSI